MAKDPNYTEDDIKSLSWVEHIRLRPGMYIGKLGDGSQPDDGIYILLKETLDNCIDEFAMGYGKRVEVILDDDTVEVRDYGRGIPLGKLMECAAQINTGAKYDSDAFQRSVGLNGVGIKAVNALSSFFEVQAFREGKTRAITFSRGKVVEDMPRPRSAKGQEDGTRVMFTPDAEKFGKHFTWNPEFIEEMLLYYSFLNPGLTLELNGKKFKSKNGLVDLLEAKMDDVALYPIIHFADKEIEVAFTHLNGYGEDYYSFVNGQHTTMGGTHLAALREGIVKEVREFFKKTYEPTDVRTGICAAISVKVQEPVFESQTKTKLGSTHMEPKGRPIRGYVSSVITEQLDNFLHRNRDTATAIQERILRNERERKELKGIQTASKAAARKTKVHNKKLRDCRIHFDTKHKRREVSTLFITEGDSASGSITKSRDVESQAVFSLRGKPKNCYGEGRKAIYDNEELALLLNAIGIENDIEDLRYNRIVVATDADVDGMHIRLLLMTYFLQFFPDLIKRGHVYILQTPLFRVRNKKDTHYCYSDEERAEALAKLGKNPEITRFKGLGEISPDEFKHFIGPDIRLDPVVVDNKESIREMLAFYMGKNTPDRQLYIIDNLRIELDVIDEDEAEEELIEEEQLATA